MPSRDDPPELAATLISSSVASGSTPKIPYKEGSFAMNMKERNGLQAGFDMDWFEIGSERGCSSDGRALA